MKELCLVIAGIAYLILENALLSCRIDDPLGSFSVHFGGGFVGVILTPFFMMKEHSGMDGILFWEGCETDKAENIPGFTDGECLYRKRFE